MNRDVHDNTASGDLLPLESLFEQSPYPFFITDYTGIFLRVNRAFVKFIGVEESFLSETSSFTYVHTDDVPKIREAFITAREQKHSVSLTIRFKNQREGYQRFTCKLISDEELKQIYFLVTNVVYPVLPEDENNRVKELYQAIFRNAREHIILIDEKYVILDINHTSPGINRDQVIGENILSFAQNKEEGEKMKRALLTCFESAKSSECASHYEVNDTRYYYQSFITPLFGLEKRPTKALIITQDATEKHTLQVELNHYKGLTDISSDFFCITDLGGKIVNANAAFYNQLGYSKQELLYNPFIEFIHTEDVQTTLAQLQKVSENDQKVDFYNRFRKKDGSYTVLQWRFAKNDRSELYYAVGKNISKISSLEKQLDQEKKNAELYFDAAQVLFLVLDNKGCIRKVNKQGCQLLKYAEEDLVGKNWFDVILPEENREHFRNQFIQLQLVESESIPLKNETEAYLLNSKGEKRLFHFQRTVLIDDEGVFSGVILSGVDITAHRKSLQQLKNSEELHRTLVKNAPNLGLIIFDKAHKLLLVDGKVLKHAGIDTNNWKGKTIHDLFDKEIAESFSSFFENTLEGESKTVEYEWENHFYELQFIPIVDHLGMVSRGMLIIYETTGFKDVQQELLVLNKSLEKKVEERTESLAHQKNVLEEMNSRLKEFVQAAAHDLRSPANAMKSLLSLVPRVETKEKREEIYHRLNQASSNLSRVLDGLIELLEAQIREEVDVELLFFEDFIKECEERFYEQIEQTNARIITDFSSNGHIHYPRPFLDSIFSNLINNALKYRNLDERPIINIRSYFEDKYCVLSIKDNGMGMDLDKHREKLFKPFKRLTAEREGNGIGLSIVKNIITRNGGKIEVDSVLGSGTEFRLYLIPYAS